MVTVMHRFDLSDGLAAALISGSQFSSSSSSNTVTPLSVTYSYDPDGNMTQLGQWGHEPIKTESDSAVE